MAQYSTNKIPKRKKNFSLWQKDKVLLSNYPYCFFILVFWNTNVKYYPCFFYLYKIDPNKSVHRWKHGAPSIKWLLIKKTVQNFLKKRKKKEKNTMSLNI